MYNYIFLVVWLAYGLVESIIVGKKYNGNRSKSHVLSLSLWIMIGVLLFYLFFFKKTC